MPISSKVLGPLPGGFGEAAGLAGAVGCLAGGGFGPPGLSALDAACLGGAWDAANGIGFALVACEGCGIGSC